MKKKLKNQKAKAYSINLTKKLSLIFSTSKAKSVT